MLTRITRIQVEGLVASIIPGVALGVSEEVGVGDLVGVSVGVRDGNTIVIAGMGIRVGVKVDVGVFVLVGVNVTVGV